MDLFLHVLSAEGFDLKVDAAGLKDQSEGVRRRLCMATGPTGSEGTKLPTFPVSSGPG